MKKLMSIVIGLIILAQTALPRSILYAEDSMDVTDLLINKEFTIYQGEENSIAIDKIDVSKDIRVNLKFKVPVINSDFADKPGGRYVKWGDYAKIKITKDLKINAPRTEDLIGPEYDGVKRKVGTFTIEEENIGGEDWVVAEILFDGESIVFDTLDNVEFQSAITFLAGSIKRETISETTQITVLEKDYTLEIPSDLEIKVKKTGIFDLNHLKIDWQIILDADMPVDLSGYYLEDVMRRYAVEKVEEKFPELYDTSIQIESQGIVQTLTPALPEPGKFTAVLPAGSISPVKISYASKVMAFDAYHHKWDKRGQENEINLIRLNGGVEVKRFTARAKVDVPRKIWIEKDGKIIGKKIIWEIIINHSGLDLEDVQIIDKLPAGSGAGQR